MKELILAAVTLAFYIAGYFLMKRLDLFISDNQRLIADGRREGQRKLRIGAESPSLLHTVSSALESFSAAEPHIAVFLSSGKRERLLEKLLDEQLDIVLLGSDCPAPSDSRYAALTIPFEAKAAPIRVLGLPVESLDRESRVCVVWKKELKSKDRDRVIFALEYEHCSLKCAYADYMGR